MAASDQILYRAFLSYSHQDADWGRKIHGKLESFAIDRDLVGRASERGPVPANLRPIFRDREELNAGHDLSQAIKAALDASASLIVLCSPHAARSGWVNEEARLFQLRHPDRPVIPVILDGRPGDADQECLVPALRFAVDPDGTVTDRPIELLAADVREAGDGLDLGLAKVVGTLIGLRADQVYQRIQRQFRQRMRRWTVGLASVACVLAGLAIWAVINSQLAERNLGVAKSTVNAMIFDLTNELRGLRGARIEAIESILTRTKTEMDKLQEPIPLERWLQLRWQSIRDLLAPPAHAQDADIERSRAGRLLQEGVTRAARSDIDGQERLAQEAATILRRLMVRSPDDIELPRELSVALNKIGEARHSKGNPTGAAQAFTESLRLIEQLLAKFPDRPLLQRDAYVPLVWLGNLALEAGRLQEAETTYRKGLTLIDRALAADLRALNIPDHIARLASIDRPSLERERATALNKLGDVAAARGDHPDALRHYEESHALRKRLVEADPSDGLLFRQLTVSKGNIGLSRYALKDFNGAAAIFEEAVAGWRELLKSDPNNASYQRDLSIGLNQLGSTLLELGQQERARQILIEDLELTRAIAVKDRTNVGLKQELLASVTRMAQVSLLPPPDVPRACTLLSEAEKLSKEGVPTAPDVSDVLAKVKQVVTAAGLQLETCRPTRS